jgi:predicted DNA-binding ribbon-helix-helix protein
VDIARAAGDRGDRPIKHSFSIAGHRTSISLEAPFWDALKEIAAQRQCPLAEIVTTVDAARGGANLSSAVRVWILEQYRRGAEGGP